MRQRSKRRVSLVLLTLLLSMASPIIFAAGDSQSGDAVWTSTSVGEMDARNAAAANPGFAPTNSIAVDLEPSALDAVLARLRWSPRSQAKQLPVILTLPRPDGRFERFAVRRAQ